MTTSTAPVETLQFPGGDQAAAGSDDPLPLLEQGDLPAGADLERFGRPRSAALRGPHQPRAADQRDGSEDKLEIRLAADREKKTLTIEDNGIGMSRAEVIANIGTIAKSGTRELVNRLKQGESKQTIAELIGQFGAASTRRSWPPSGSSW
jgi:hypothetical protein